MSAQTTQYNVFQQLTSVRLADSANLAGSYLNGPLNNGVGATLTANSVGVLTIDSVVANLNDRILLTAQTNANENGIYVVTQAGGPSAVWVLTRSADQQCIEQLKAGQFLSVNAGTAHAGGMWVLVEPLPANFGVDGLHFNGGSVLGGGTPLLAANNLSDVASVATARTNLGAQASASIRAQKIAFAGGAASVVHADASISAASVVTCTIESSANAVEVQKATPGAGSLTVLMSGDPGVSVISYIALSAAQ